jgi:hypothetical protein
MMTRMREQWARTVAQGQGAPVVDEYGIPLHGRTVGGQEGAPPGYQLSQPIETIQGYLDEGTLPGVLSAYHVYMLGLDENLLEGFGYSQDAFGNWIRPQFDDIQEEQTGGGGRRYAARRRGYGGGYRRSSAGYPYISNTGRYYNANEMGLISWRI